MAAQDDPPGDAELAARAAEAAARLLLRLRAGGRVAGPGIGAEGDRLANGIILDLLRRWRPDDGILSEESPDDPERLGKERVWIVDPLDGTREYAQGRDDWAVHVALAVRGEAIDGAVAVPGMGRLFRTDTVTRPVLSGDRRPRMLVSRTRPPKCTAAAAAAVGADVLAMGSAGAKAMAVVAGEAEVYLHSGGQHEWDNCAPVAVAKAAGLHVSRCDGGSLVYNRAPPFVPDLLICRRELAAPLLRALESV